MGAQMAYLWAILLFHCSRVLVQSSGSAPAIAPSLGAETIPTVVIQSRAPLPLLPVLQESYRLDIGIARIIGPGHKGASDHPYVEYTGRLYNGQLTAGIVRGMQGKTMRATVCNGLPGQAHTLNSSFNYASEFTGRSAYRDPNIAAHHFHGHFGNPGTDNVPCDPPGPPGVTCYRGDNIFADILPGQCNEYQYDVASDASPGTFWMHPHHKGSASLMIQTCSLPAVVDENPNGGFDYLATPSCGPYRAYFIPDNEVIMHMQTFLMAVESSNSSVPGHLPGPTDDGYISDALRSVPQDPFCCAGPDQNRLGAGAWKGVGGVNSTGNSWDPSVSEEPFYTSGQSAQFTIINGVYQPIISMTAGRVYRWRMIQASTMMWMDLSLNGSGCHWGIYSRDGNFLRSFPRMTDHIVMASANRVDAFVVCEPGTYRLQTGQGPLDVDPNCGSPHCELLNQTTLATLQVSAQGGSSVNASMPFGAANCAPQFPGYLADLTNTPANQDMVSHITARGVMNFTHDAKFHGPPSAGCLVNYRFYDEGQPLQEVIGEVTELSVDNIDQHPYHHHVQPYQIVALDNDTDAMNAWWRVGDYVDTLMLPSCGLKNATVRWIPGPLDITGVGYAVLHCHISQHSDKGCIMKTQILERTRVSVPHPSGRGFPSWAVAGIVVGALAAVLIAAAVPVVLLMPKWRRAGKGPREESHGLKRWAMRRKERETDRGS